MTSGRNGHIVTFYSQKGGTGRTMAMANVAWILASNGYRVLASDWDIEAPGLHRYFHPFLPSTTVTATTGVLNLFADYVADWRNSTQSETDLRQHHARVLPHAVSLNWAFPGGGTLDYLSAGRQDGEYVTNLMDFSWREFTEQFKSERFLDALRHDMKTHYDYTFIDSRAGVSDLVALCTLDLPDVLVNCFTMSSQSIEGAAGMARSIARDTYPRAVRILPVAMRVNGGQDSRLTAARELVRASFPELPARYWAGMEIPHHPDYTYEETLAIFGDRPEGGDTLLAAFERLTSGITDGRVGHFPPLDDDLRRRHLGSFVRPMSPVATPLVLSYVPQDRMWADWVSWILTRSGFQVLTPAAGADPATRPGVSPRTVALLSSSFLRSPQSRTLWDSISTVRPDSPPKLVPVRIEQITLTAPFTHYAPVDLTSLDEMQAAEALLRGLDHSAEATERSPGAGRPRFPNNVPSVWDAPPRNPLFVGRDRLLDQLHATLNVSRRAAILPHGRLSGCGRTQLAVEYAHRFQADYDLVWWIRADTRDAALTSLARLAEQLGLPTGGGVPQSARLALDCLGRGTPHGRWLLVFDNIGDPAELSGLVPSDGPGHVLVTSRDSGWTEEMDSVEVVEVDAFSRDQSVELLRRRAPAISIEDADLVADALQDLPLAIAQAGAWLAQTPSVEGYRRELTAQDGPPPAGLSGDLPHPAVLASTRVALASLAARAPAALRLLVLCSHLAPLPVPLGLVHNDTTLHILRAHDDTLREPLLLVQVVRELSRLGLAEVDQAAHTLRVHRVVQSLTRARCAGDEGDKAQHEVHRILSAASPRREDTEDPYDDAFERLWPHMDHARAESCRDDETRAALIERLRCTAQRGLVEQALTLGRRLDRLWAADSESGADRHVLLLRHHLAAVLRDLGRYDEARDLDRATLRGQRELLPPGHPHILMTAEGLAADLRPLGRFTEALELDREAAAGFREAFGEEHPRALGAAGALATSLRLAGDYAASRELGRATWQLQREVLGQRHRSSLVSALGLARDLREAGEYAGSVPVLRSALATLDGQGSPGELRAAVSLSVSLRRIGQQDEADSLASAADERYRAMQRPDSPDTLACEVNLAALLAEAGDMAAASTISRQLRRRFAQVCGTGHPDALVCDHNLAVCLRGAGELSEALKIATRTVQAFAKCLGDSHPYTLCSKVTLANVLADLDQFGTVEELAQSCAKAYRNVLGPTHPDTVIAEACLAVTLRSLDREQEALRLRDRATGEFARQLGEGHAWTLAARQWERIDRDLEPLLPS
ncbi:FxSxx-COOH system tetratricopeptide repeat protein [Streptomyces sp. NPDC059373]